MGLPLFLLLLLLTLLPGSQGISISKEQLDSIKSQGPSETKESTTFSLQGSPSSSQANPALEPLFEDPLADLAAIIRSEFKSKRDGTPLQQVKKTNPSLSWEELERIKARRPWTEQEGITLKLSPPSPVSRRKKGKAPISHPKLEEKPLPRFSPSSPLSAASSSSPSRAEREFQGKTQLPRPYSPPLSPFTKLVSVFEGGLGGCSGTLISEFHVLTAGHCVYVRETSEQASNVYVSPGMTDVLAPGGTDGFSSWTDKPFGTALGVSISLYGYESSTDDNWPLYDYAIITLDRPIGQYAGYHLFHYNYLPSRTIINVVGYPAVDFDGRFQYLTSGNSESEDGLIIFDAVVCQGDSGSGVYIFQDDPEARIVSAVTSFNLGCQGDSCCIAAGGGPYITGAIYNQITTTMSSSTAPSMSSSVWELSRDDLEDDLKGVTAQTSPGGPMEVYFHLVNYGPASTPGFTVTYYFSEDLTELTSSDFQALSAGSFVRIKQTIQAPSTAGEWSIFAIFEAENDYSRTESSQLIYLGTTTTNSVNTPFPTTADSFDVDSISRPQEPVLPSSATFLSPNLASFALCLLFLLYLLA